MKTDFPIRIEGIEPAGIWKVAMVDGGSVPRHKAFDNLTLW